MKRVIAYDIGTTGVKTCLFEIDRSIRLIDSASRKYPLYILPDGGAEQDGDDWWKGMADSTKEVIERTGIDPHTIDGLSFCSQMQGLVLVDKDGVPVHRPMSYMDQRATEEVKKGMSYGIQIAGANILKAIPSLIITGAVTSSVKDPVWKCKWIEAHEPENFARAYRWLDVKDYLTARCTGRFTMTEDSAFSTLICDTRPGRVGWNKTMNKMFNIREDLLPEIIKSTDLVGPLTAKAAEELGLAEGTPVFGGGGDSSLIGVGAGCVKVGDTHIYSGTSGWVITVVDKQMVDVSAMIAAVTGADSGKYNYFAEMETAGKAIEWAKNTFLLDGTGYYTDAEHAEKPDTYNFLCEAIKDIEPGSGGVIFAPWLHGNRCPFEDPASVGVFIGAKIETTKAHMFKAVVEGVFYHLRWMLECQDKKIKTSDTIRFVGGTALSPLFCQILSDILGRKVETVESPQNVGSVGAAAVMAVGLGLAKTLTEAASFIPANATYEPDMEKHAAYEQYYQAFKKLYKANKDLFKTVKGEN